MQSLVVSALDSTQSAVEVVERKGIGHPDTICDALAETLSRNLCREYRRRFGQILHHNVDKALLCAGRATPAFGAGLVLAPMMIYLAGRAATEIGDVQLPIRDIAIEGSRSWLRSNLHALDPDSDVEINTLIHPGSQHLQGLFSRRGREDIPLANDTSFGVGYSPRSALERLVLSVEERVNARDRQRAHPAWGEDIKVMGIRNANAVHLTIACAMIGRYLRDLNDYVSEKSAIQKLAQELALQHGFADCKVAVNHADDPSNGAIYLTVTGTSAESGDDGQVGRGNRVNGLITPCRPMSLEAAAGKNPVSHVGKMYNVIARNICEALIAIPGISAANCLLVSQIGTPITNPAIVEVKLMTEDGSPIDKFHQRVEEIVATELAYAPKLVDDFINGTVNIF
jgi:S-adenosylmethionine synthetase